MSFIEFIAQKAPEKKQTNCEVSNFQILSAVYAIT